jgi:hypothetical protein
MGFLCCKEDQGDILLTKPNGPGNQLKATPGEEYGPDAFESRCFKDEVRRLSQDERK